MYLKCESFSTWCSLVKNVFHADVPITWLEQALIFYALNCNLLRVKHRLPIFSPKLALENISVKKNCYCSDPLIWPVFTCNFFQRNVLHLYYVRWTVFLLNWTKVLLPNPSWMETDIHSLMNAAHSELNQYNSFSLNQLAIVWCLIIKRAFENKSCFAYTLEKEF